MTIAWKKDTLGELLDQMVATNTSERFAPIPAGAPTRTLEVKGDNATVDVSDEEVTNDAGLDVLVAKGLNPQEWESTGFRRSEWTMANGEMGESARFTFKRRPLSAIGVDIDDLLQAVERDRPKMVGYSVPPVGTPGIIVPIADLQIGKNDMVEWTGTDAVDHTISLIDATAARIANETGTVDDRPVNELPEVAVNWLGDHVEGFVSQGGSNAWRTQLTLVEQLRISRRLMLHAVQKFYPLASRLTCTAVPGNHGEAVRFQNKGITRYDDSHDTEALVAVSEAVGMSGKYPNARFLIPDTDELTVAYRIANTGVLNAHGHAWARGKAHDWWKGQTYHGNAGADATLLLFGHGHHLWWSSEGKRVAMQLPALESGSQWWRHKTGTRPHPGLVTLKVLDGQVLSVDALWGCGLNGRSS